MITNDKAYRYHVVMEATGSTKKQSLKEVVTGLMFYYLQEHGKKHETTHAIYKGTPDNILEIVDNNTVIYLHNKYTFLINSFERLNTKSLKNLFDECIPSYLKVCSVVEEELENNIEQLATKFISPLVYNKRGIKNVKKYFDIEDYNDEFMKKLVDKTLRGLNYENPDVNVKLLNDGVIVTERRYSKSNQNQFFVKGFYTNLLLVGDPKQIQSLRISGLGQKKGQGYGCIL